MLPVEPGGPEASTRLHGGSALRDTRCLRVGPKVSDGGPLARCRSPGAATDLVRKGQCVSRPCSDLDEHSTYLRVPGSNSRPFRDDNHLSALTRIDAYPRVGARFIFRYQRVDQPHRFEERHATSAVRRIERVTLM